MSDGRTEVGTAQRVGSGLGRLLRAWRGLPSERQLAAIAAIGLFLTLFLPWYQVTVIATGGTRLQSASASLTGWGAFSFVEGAVLLVAAAVLTLLFQRAEGRAFHLPGGDGWVIMAAGFWTCLLVVWRMFDKQGTTSHGQYADTYGIEWGIFVALAVAALLAYSGSRIRAAHRPEPPLPGEDTPTDPLPPRPAARPEPAPPKPAATPVPSAALPARTAEHFGRAEAATPRAAAGPAPIAEHVDPPGDPPEFRIPPARAPRPTDDSEAPTQRRPRPDPPDQRPPDSEAPTQRGPRRVRPPRPVRATDPTTRRLGPSTPAARTRSSSPEDEQLTIPLEQED